MEQNVGVPQSADSWRSHTSRIGSSWRLTVDWTLAVRC